MDALTVGAAARPNWSPRMLRYLEDLGLVVPRRTPAGYRVYGLAELNQLRALQQLRTTFGVEPRRDGVRRPAPPRARAARARSTTGSPPADDSRSWIEWEQRKHERLLAA